MNGKWLFPVFTFVFVLLFFSTHYSQGLPTIAHGLPFNKVVVWGHANFSHTHSYIHYGFEKAFRYIGYPTYWVNTLDEIRSLDLANTLFITEGQVDKDIPIRSDCFYILHNCEWSKYKRLFDRGHAIILQVYTHDVLTRDVHKVDECIYYDIQGKVLYMPWATDLLPHEIDKIKKELPLIKKDKVARFIGSVWGKPFGNDDKIEAFGKACRDAGIPFECKRVNVQENIQLIKTAYVAPTIVGQWQEEKGYVPCRAFKNISYGNFGVTNSEAVYNLFKKKIVYNSDCYQLLFDAVEKAKNLDIQEMFDLMDFVRDKHTYINRIDVLLSFMSLIYEQVNKA